MQAYSIFSITTFFPKKTLLPIDQYEIDLVKRCQNRDLKAMEEIVKKYETQVYNIAYGILGSLEDAQDITQDVFVSVWEKIGQFRFKYRYSHRLIFSFIAKPIRCWGIYFFIMIFIPIFNLTNDIYP